MLSRRHFYRLVVLLAVVCLLGFFLPVMSLAQEGTVDVGVDRRVADGQVADPPLQGDAARSGLGAYPAPTQPAPTPWPTATAPLPSPTAPLPTMPVVPPQATPTAFPPVPPAPTGPAPIPTYTPGQLAALPQLAPARGRHVPGQGGAVGSGAVQISLPAQAHGRPLTLDLRQDSVYPRLPVGLQPRLLLTVDLTDESTGGPVHDLDQPAELRLDLARLPGPTATLLHLQVVHWDETAQRWEALPSQRQGATLTVAVRRFSPLGLAQDYGPDWQPPARLDAANTDLFSGGASFTIPLEVPQGINGLAPTLSLNYASVVADQMNATIADDSQSWDNDSPATQADWTGLGWSLGLGRINVTGDKEQDDAQNDLKVHQLELNGISEKLVCVPEDSCDDVGADTNDREYKTERDSFLKIWRRPYGPQGPYFEVWDKAGTYYRFGYTADSHHQRGIGHGGGAWGLSLDLVQDTFGAQMTIEYFEDDHDIDDGGPAYTRAAYPALIRYTLNAAGFGSGTTFGQHYQREVRFNEALWVGNDPKVWSGPNRDDWLTEQQYRGDPQAFNQYFYVQRYKLDEIRTYVKPSSGASMVDFRRYSFDYDYATPTWDRYHRQWDNDGRWLSPEPKLRLRAIKEWGGAGFTQALYRVTPNDPAVASYSFTYATPNIGRLQLSRLDTAIGGAAEFSYENYSLGPAGRSRVTTRRLLPGAGDPDIVTTYSYGPARYDWTKDRFIGHDWSRATDAAGHSVRHFYFTDQAITDATWTSRGVNPATGDLNWLRGREYGTEYIHRKADAGDGDTLGYEIKRRVVNHYEAAWMSVEGKARHTRLLRTATERDPEGMRPGSVDIVAYTYVGYDNVNGDYECPNQNGATATCGPAGGWERRTERWFEPLDVGNVSGVPGGRRYIVDRVIMEGTHKSDSGWGEWWPKVTYYNYDERTGRPWVNGAIQWGVAGPTSQGKLTLVRRLDCWQCSPEETTADTKYDYDLFGNVITTTTYAGFGVNGQTPAQPRAVTTDYDPTKAFVTRVMQPGSQVWEQADYGGTDPYRWERPNWVEDANGSGSRTSFSYDDFGRLLTVARPGDTTANPTLRYEYQLLSLSPSGPEWLVRTVKRLDETRTMTSRTFYDGLGRPILTKNPDPNDQGTNQAQAAATFYDSRGMKSAETVPYWPGSIGADGGNNDTFHSAGPTHASLQYTRYAYDQFGELAATTRPDASQALVTTIGVQRARSLAERGAEFGLPSSLNPSFELRGGSDTCAAGWTCIPGVVERIGTQADGRFALRLNGAAAQAAASYGSAVFQPATYSLSWTGRRTAGSGPLTVELKNSAGSATLVSASVTLTDTVWMPYHWSFTYSGAAQSGFILVFSAGAGTTVELDDIRLSWGEARERVETQDGLGRLVKVQERTDTAAWLTTEYSYNPLDQARTVKNPAGQIVTEYQYHDAQNRTRLKTQTMSDLDRGGWSYEYDPQGNVIKQQDGRGQWLTLCYDDLDRLTQKHAGQVGCGTANPLASYVYDEPTAGTFRKGRLYRVNTGDGANDRVEYSYDGRGRVTHETRRIGTWTFPTLSSYNSADRVRTLTYPDTEVVTYTYNAAGQPLAASGVQGGVTTPYLTSQSFDVQGRPTLVQFGNSVSNRYWYYSAAGDSRLNRLSQLLTQTASNAVLSDLRYDYDRLGNVTAVDVYNPQGVLDAAESQRYRYDSLSRLVEVKTAEATPRQLESFSYTDLGNLLRRGTTTYSYTTSKPHAVTHVSSDPNPRFGYDNAGNMTTRGSQSLVYDAEGRLTQVKRDATNALEEYTYDGNGALIRRKLTPPPSAVQLSDPLTTQGSHWVTGWSGSGSVSFNVNPNDGSSHTTTLRVSGNGVDWTTNARRTGTISQGQVARLAFKLSQTGSGAVLALETTDTAYYFGVYEEAGALRLRVKQNAVYTNVGTLLATVSANVWYGLELAVDGAAGFRVRVWREDTPGVRDELRYEMPAGTSWRFHAWAKSGSVYVDGSQGDGYSYVEETPTLSAADARLVGKHYEYDSVSGQTTKRYYVGGRLVATRTGSSVRYVHADHLGSTTTLTDQSGAVMAREKYSAFGERRRGESPLITDQLYTGQRYNALSSLYHYSDGKSAGRFYDPLLGRFVSADSVTPGSSSQTLNRFSYGLNNPVRYIDPNGQACIDANAGGGIGVGAAYAVGMSIGNEISRQAAQWGQRITQWGPQVTATVDKAAGIAKSAQQNTENAQRASHSNSGETGDPQPPRDPNDLKSKLRDASPDVLRQAVQEDLKKFSEAHEYGVKSYNALSRDTAHTGLQAHHLIEKRFANILGVQQGDIPSIALKAGEHQKFTNRWLEQIGRINMHTPLRTDSATRSDIWNAAQVVYQEYPGLLETIRQYLQVP